jgi:hypothetical protein
MITPTDINKIVKTNHKITYNDANLNEKFNIKHENENEKEELADLIYKYDLLSIFGLDDFLEEIILEKMANLYNIMVEYKEIYDICSNIHDCVSTNGLFDKITKDDKFQYFMVLFSYDNLYLFYPCICEFFEKGMISADKITKLKNNLFV